MQDFCPFSLDLDDQAIFSDFLFGARSLESLGKYPISKRYISQIVRWSKVCP